MSIEKITITTPAWKDGERISIETEVSRENYKGDFDQYILKEIDNSEIEHYAEYNRGMIEEDECDCRSSLEDFSDEDLIANAEDRGLMFFKCHSIIDKMKLDKLKEIIEFP